MGNSQSNPADKIKIYKIIKVERVDFKDKEKGNGFILELNDYVTYRNDKRKEITLLIKGELDKNRHDYKVGDYLTVDLNITSLVDSTRLFIINDKVWDGNNPIRTIEKEYVIEKRDSNGTFIKFVCDTAEFFGEMAENRERYQASIVDARMSNYTNLRQTSYDMPPKW